MAMAPLSCVYVS